MNENYRSIIHIYILSISMHTQNLIEIHKLIYKILSINKILTLINGHNSVKNRPKIMCIKYNKRYTKCYQISSICSKDIEENIFLHQSRTITLLFMNDFSPFAMPNHSSPISMSMQSLKKFGQKLLKLQPGNEAPTDGRGRTLKRFEGYNIIPHHFLRRGIKTV